MQRHCRGFRFETRNRLAVIRTEAPADTLGQELLAAVHTNNVDHVTPTFLHMHYIVS
jgi:hypothetical protein